MANVSRKAIAAAILALIAPGGGPFAQSGRRLTKPESAASPGKPALFLIKPNEKITPAGAGMPPEREMRFVAVIYTSVAGLATAVPADIIDDLVDYVTVALAPTSAQQIQSNGRQTLGGALGVYDCAIDGEVIFMPGDQQGVGETLVQIKVLLNQYP